MCVCRARSRSSNESISVVSPLKSYKNVLLQNLAIPKNLILITFLRNKKKIISRESKIKIGGIEKTAKSFFQKSRVSKNSKVTNS